MERRGDINVRLYTSTRLYKVRHLDVFVVPPPGRGGLHIEFNFCYTSEWRLHVVRMLLRINVVLYPFIPKQASHPRGNPLLLICFSCVSLVTPMFLLCFCCVVSCVSPASHLFLWCLFCFSSASPACFLCLF